MKFARLAEYFERLEGTTKRLEMFQILSELFQEAEAEEIDKIVYLLEEQLLPPFKGLEIGMAEKLIARAIAKAADRPDQEVMAEYKRLGDLGLVAEGLLKKKAAKRALDVVAVYEELLEIAKTAGEGSVEQKIQLLADLLRNTSPKEARYIVRFAMGQLRLGIGDPTILDALSLALVQDRSFRPELERAYNLCSDLGLVAKTLFEKGKKGIHEFKVSVFSPIRMAMAERLATAEEIVKKIGRCSIEGKFDGLRMQVHKMGDHVEAFSRNLERMTPMVPDLVEATRKQIKAKAAIFEGEAVAINEETGELYPFQVTVQRKRKYGIEEMIREFPLVLFTFD
ncbi:MAG: ATP-dependent DNA ligase, partial [Candidatus Methylomirabilales bacterium]